MSATPHTTFADPLLGHQLANFRIEKVLRRGGMAQIYRGRDVKLDRPVAIKVIDARYRGDPAYAQRFVAEARAMAAWHHPHIIQVYYADDQDGLYYYVMEFVDGLDLAELLAVYAADGELIPHEDVLTIGRAVAGALDYAHDQGVIHRDVKPSNVLVSARGRVLLTDFGLALTVDAGSQGEILGTPHYVAPEQARSSADAVPQSDLYSLGIILYEMLTGSVPFDDPSPATLLLRHMTESPSPPRQLNPALNTETEAVLLKALRKSPAERYQTGAALLEALTVALETAAPARSGKPHTLDLPPLPAAVSGKPLQPARRISSVSVVERIAMQLGERAVLSTRPQTESKMGRPWLVPAMITVLLLVFLLTIPLLLNNTSEEPRDAAAVQIDRTATATVSPPTRSLLAGLPPTTPSVNALTTGRPATVTATPPPLSATTSPAQAGTSTPVATTTPAFPQSGRPLRLFYDDSSFFIWNRSDQPVDVGMLAFAAVNREEEQTGSAFQGREWRSFYPTLRADTCNALELGTATAVINPASCREYNARMLLFSPDDRIFWTSPSDDAFAFIVYWGGRPVGRCIITAGVCNLFLPE